MKTTLIALASMFFAVAAYAQNPTEKIVLNKGQKITATTSMSVTNEMMGMNTSTSSVTENLLEVKNVTDKDYTIANTLTRVKMNIEMPGNNTSYDSEKKEDQTSEMGQSMADKLNKTTELNIDNRSGRILNPSKSPEKKPTDQNNPMQGVMQMFGVNWSDEMVISGAFQLIPKGLKIGDSWKDSSAEGTQKSTRTYTYASNSDSGAVIKLNMITDATSSMDFMGMNIDMTTNTNSNSDILIDGQT